VPALVIGGETIEAVSVGGMETCIELPEWKLCFDIGRCPPSATRHPRVLFTHAHTDHMGGVIHHCATRDMMGMAPPQYVLPAENHEAFLAMLEAWRRLDHSPLPCTVVAARPGDVIDLGPGRVARAFKAYHRVPTLGWALCSRKNKLRPDLVGSSREEIVRRRNAGEDINTHEEEVRIAFCGDTLIEVIDREELPRKAKVLVLEVTFLDDKVPVAKARSKGHIHLDEIVTRADRFENDHLLLTHVSQRYSNADAEAIVRKKLPKHLSDRVTVLPHAPPWSWA